MSVLTPDLLTGFHPIHVVSSTFAIRIAQAKKTKRPVAITRKGSVFALLLSVDHPMCDRLPRPDLNAGVVPISKSAIQLARLIDRSFTSQRTVAITQKGLITALLMHIDIFDAAMGTDSHHAE